MTEENVKHKVKEDLVFKYLFSKSYILKSFLQEVLKKNINDLEVKSSYALDIKNIMDKKGVLDIRAIINKNIVVDLEMQQKVHSGYIKRLYLYFSELINHEIDSGKEYSDIKDIIIINVLNENIFPDFESFHTVWEIKERKGRIPYALPGLEIHFLELKKFREEYNIDLKNKLNQWLAFIDGENERWVSEVMVKNEEIKKANEDKKEFSKDKDMIAMLEAYKKFELDTKQYMEDLKTEAEKVGEKRGEKRGEKIGLELGEKKGIKLGEKRQNEIVAKNMLKENINIALIMKVTGLPETKIKSLA